MEYEISLPIDAIPQKRPRLSSLTNKVYNPQAKQKKVVKLLIASALSKQNIIYPMYGPVRLDISIQIKPPYSTSTKKKEALYGEYHTKKPDIDNCLKFLLDCANELIFLDDSQVSKICCEKIYAESSKTIIKVKSLRKT